MNVNFERYYYNFLQSMNGYPQVEGGVNRVLPETYAYINSNLLLSTWKRGKAVHCLPNNAEAFNAALKQLREDGFTHLVFHEPRRNRLEAFSFASVPAAYQDKYVSIYRVEDLSQSCGNAFISDQDTFAHLGDLALSLSFEPDRDVTVLSVHPTQRIDNDLFNYFKSVFAGWSKLIHVYAKDGEIAVQSEYEQYVDLRDISGTNQLIMLTYDPRQIDSLDLDEMNEWIARKYRSCGRVIETDNTIAEFLVKSEYPCSLIDIDNVKKVEYTNGLILANNLHSLVESTLDIYLHWENRPHPDEPQAYSLQIFDAADQKAHQQDFVIGNESLAFHRLDLSALPPGDYVLKLIVYDYGTGVSVPGMITSSQMRFDRELELVRFELEQ